VLALVIASLAWGWLRARRRSAYRRAGLALLPEAHSIYEVSVLLKRVALAAWPRSQVASLHGPDWVNFLEDNCPGSDLKEIAGPDPTAQAGIKVRNEAEKWIRGHRVDPLSVKKQGD
jgi:hypothetical protein